MRTGAIVATVLLLLPVDLSAQRFPRVWGRDPARPAPLPPQPAAIARQMAYKRLRIAFESYPLISYVQSPGVPGAVVPPKRTSFGAGSRADYRMTRHVSATFDVTSSFLGGMTNTETAEMGFRLRPERTEHKVYPFLDARVGYVHASETYFRPFDVLDGSAGQPSYGGRYSQGFGGVGGAGMEYALTRRFSLTTAATVLRSRMRAYSLYSPAPANGRYSMTSYRFTFGLRYNPVRLITPIGTGLP